MVKPEPESMMEHRIWEDDEFPVHAARLVEKPGFLPAGCIELRYIGRDGEKSHIICANQADDFMERYRAAPDAEAQEHLMIHEIRKPACP